MSLPQIFEELKSKGVKFDVKANFAKDIEQSLKHSVDIYKGVTVTLPTSYVLSEADKSWLHPDLIKTRAVYARSTYDQKANVGDFSSLVGSYYTHKVDDIGAIKKEEFTVVDTGVELDEIWSELFEGMTIKQAYSKLALTKLENNGVKKSIINTSIDKANFLAKSNSPKATYHYNMLYKASGSYLFYNHVMKPVNGKVLVHVSPLIGFVEQNTSSEIHSDLLSEKDFLNVNKLKEEQRNRAYSDCYWTGGNVVNTFTMRKPVPNYKNLIKNSVVYRMEKGVFSPNPIVDKLPVDIILFLTPEAKNIPTNRNFEQDLSKNVIKMKANVDTLQKLTKYYKSMFKEHLIQGDNLLLPRDIVERIA